MVRKIGKVAAIIVLAVVLAFAGLILFLSATEYKPQAEEPLDITGTAGKTLHEQDTIRLLSWNVGYGALGDNADFFMDGGSMVNTADTDRVHENMQSLMAGIREADADLILLQETDRDSARSHHIDETALFAESLPDMVSTFANNFKVAFLPYPIPPIGKVDSGLLTFSAFPVKEAARVSLPVPFKWPVRMANLKRCLAVHRIPLEDSDRELVLVNLHLEAYDSGEGKEQQTAMLRSILQEEADKGNYVIAGGDFNQTFSSVDLSRYPQQEGMWAPGMIDTEDFDGSWQLLMDERVPTCRSLDKVYAGAELSDFQYYVIDGFIVSGNIKVENLETLDKGFTATDHNPVLLEVKLG